jgi:aryl-alcohol dehydrogenase-like predicted oxidoreductase/nucleoside-diphosphate-sugar epimerase
MKILLLGGNRYVGVEILWHLLRAGHDLTVLALDAPPQDLRAHIRLLVADRNDAGALATLFAHEAFDAVIDNIAYEPQQVQCLMEALHGRIGRYLLTSTTETYPHGLPQTYAEDQTEIREFDLANLNESDGYNYGKRSCEAVLMKSGTPWTVLRPCMVTGPRDNLNGAPGGRRIHWFEESARSHFWAQRILDGGPLLLSCEDESVFKQCWVGDLARAYTHALAHPETAGHAYNVTGDEIWTNERMVRALAAAAGITPEIVRVPHAVFEQAGLDYAPVYGTSANWTLADNAKLKSAGWKPTPAENWLPFLLEANSAPEARAWYHTRIQEIALARHVQRRQSQDVPLPASSERPPHISLSDQTDSGAAPTVGTHQAGASLAWQRRVMRQTAGNVPLPEFFKPFRGALASGIGVGGWMGDLSTATDTRYVDTLVHAASRGINVFDTAINYRHMKAERCVGKAVQRLVKSGIPREALLVSTKGGYITHDAESARNRADYLRHEYLEAGLISDGEMARGHSVNPRFIRHQIGRSLLNLNLESVDIYYLHNPEDALVTLGAKAFRKTLTETFAVLEEAVAAGKIGCYGLATWDGLRVPTADPRHLSLATAIAAARSAAGTGQHHLAVVQLPFNIRDSQALMLPTQKVGRVLLPALQAAEALGLYVMTSASVLQGAEIPEADESRLRLAAPGHSLVTAALQIARSTPGVGTALVGMRRIYSVEEALSVASLPAAPEAV